MSDNTGYVTLASRGIWHPSVQGDRTHPISLLSNHLHRQKSLHNGTPSLLIVEHLSAQPQHCDLSKSLVRLLHD